MAFANRALWLKPCVTHVGPYDEATPGAITLGPVRRKPVFVPKQGSEVQLPREQSRRGKEVEEH